MRLAFVFLLISCGAAGCQATEARPMDFVQRPPRMVIDNPPPLLILLHGYGADERDLLPVANDVDPRFLIVLPRAPLRMRAGQYAWFWNGDSPELETSRQAVVDFIDRIVADTRTDPKRVYLAGFSQGGMMTLAVALQNPEKIAGGIVLSGRLFEDVTSGRASPDRLRGFPLLIIHGSADGTVPIRHGREARDMAQRFEMRVEYQELSTGHTIDSTTTAIVNDWLRQRLDQTSTR
jgi:phospholipase/carboxylesterase